MDDVPAEDVVLDKDEIKETFKMWGAFYADSVAVLKVTDSKATSRQGDLVKLEKWISSKYLVQEKIDKHPSEDGSGQDHGDALSG